MYQSLSGSITTVVADIWTSTVRLPRDLADAAAIAARLEGRSLNDLISQSVSEYLDRAREQGTFAEAVSEMSRRLAGRTGESA